MRGPIRVLYVDDEPALLEIGRRFLELAGGMTIITVDSAKAALELLEREEVDVVVSDYQMPGMDGIRFLIAVRERFGRLPFILFTGRGREEIAIQAINNGVDFYLQKGGIPRRSICSSPTWYGSRRSGSPPGTPSRRASCGSAP